MPEESWSWKGKDGSRGRLLYEPGNWGDLLKALWATVFLAWAGRHFGPERVNYLDPFAGAPSYPMSAQTKCRFIRARMESLAFLKEGFVDADIWPSTALMSRSLVAGNAVVFDADPDRFTQWDGIEGFTPMAAATGWDLVERAEADPYALWLVDPYDLIAEWRDYLPCLLRKTGQSSLLVYVFNRSARNAEAFAEYRAFRNALDDGLGDGRKYLGRVAADAFLPKAHHEMLLLPSLAARGHSHFGELVERLETETLALNRAQERAAAFID